MSRVVFASFSSARLEVERRHDVAQKIEGSSSEIDVVKLQDALNYENKCGNVL